MITCRTPGLSPAAQRLQQRMKGKSSSSSSMDAMLKKAYTPRTMAGQLGSGSTPGMTPGMKKRVTFGSTPAGARTDRKVMMSGTSGKSGKGQSSMTDGLL